MIDYLDEITKKEDEEKEELKQLRFENDELRAQLAKVGYPTKRATDAGKSDQHPNP